MITHWVNSTSSREKSFLKNRHSVNAHLAMQYLPVLVWMKENACTCRYAAAGAVSTPEPQKRVSCYVILHSESAARL